MTSRHGRTLRIVRVSRISKLCYSNGVKIIPFCRSRRAQRDDIFASSVPVRIKKVTRYKKIWTSLLGCTILAHRFVRTNRFSAWWWTSWGAICRGSSLSCTDEVSAAQPCSFFREIIGNDGRGRIHTAKKMSRRADGTSTAATLLIDCGSNSSL